MDIPAEGAVINVYKPAGITSFDVVRKVRRILGVKKVGHSGTLDPMAEGVLLILVGRATKRSAELSALNKFYRAEVLLGVRTDTLDITGRVLSDTSIGGISRAEVQSVLNRFVGDIKQIPPMYSAKKVNGHRLYNLARRGIEVKRKPQTVSIFSIDLVAWHSPKFTIDVSCSKGTYIRVLADDIGSELGCGACLSSLIRTGIGGYRVEDSISLEQLSAL